ncbi:MAG: DUF86 domain-containing protein [Leptolyngbyaceae cyanobacterium]
MSKDQQSILDIIDSIQLIFNYTENINWDDVDIQTQDAIIRRFTVIGEATKRLSVECRDRYPDIPWKKMAGLRDIVVHNYDDVDLDIIRDVIEIELPGLLASLQTVISGLNDR